MRSAAHYAFPRTSFRLIHARDRHDETEMELLPALVSPALDAIDVGANVGRYTALLSALARHVHAFEPHPRLARLLRAALPNNVTVEQIAISDGPGQVILHVPIVGGRQDEGLAYIDERRDPSECMTIPVESAALDSMDLDEVGFIKVDVEGHELKVLCGARKLIEVQRPIAIIEAEDRHCSGTVSDVFDFFAQRSYDGFFVFNRHLYDVADFAPSLQDPAVLVDLPDNVARRSIPYVNNFLFIPNERRPTDIRRRIAHILAH
ncbi:FkbM family methyltransferase [Beijerinckia sp. L45]|uniref:FkbM family methyltransferase n=1 Tax=Beijerinckia sp. L45 TaxID=1641855 RepID=UPI00131E13EE|nr:FkbM family methyltransferase [Beijerinckia sp. L45]